MAGTLEDLIAKGSAGALRSLIALAAHLKLLRDSDSRQLRDA